MSSRRTENSSKASSTDRYGSVSNSLMEDTSSYILATGGSEVPTPVTQNISGNRLVRRNNTSSNSKTTSGSSTNEGDGIMKEGDGIFRINNKGVVGGGGGGDLISSTRSYDPKAPANEHTSDDDEQNLQSPLSQQSGEGGLSVASSTSSDDSEEDENDYAMSIEELLYSSSSYYAIAKPVTLTMMLAALTVVFVNNEDTIANGQAAMAQAYQVWNVSSSSSTSQTLAMSLANALVMVSVICGMTFVIVLLYRMKCMKCLIGYMIMCSATLLGILGGNLLSTLVAIYSIPVDKLSFGFFMLNFAVVGVMAVFWGQGIPKYITQAYLIATAVILAWHLSYFDDWTTWTLLFMLALYDLCAVLTPCGPLKALVNLMSQEDAPEMPGLLFEADLPPEAKRPGDKTPKRANNSGARDNKNGGTSPASAASFGAGSAQACRVKIPLAIAKVYQLPVISIPEQSKAILNPNKLQESNVSASPLLTENRMYGESAVALPESPTPEQLRALVLVKLPANGGRLEQVSKRGKKVYLERDRHGNPKRILWVERDGKVYAEMREDDEDGPERNSIRLGLGDFIFYSVLVSKAAQYSFTTFAACMLVILAGLGGTLVLLSVYHHALPALPISIFLGVVFYLLTRLFVEPWVEAVLYKPYYV